ncbi:MAG TPA: ABC-2 family transporter protein [Myxococcaceae bacterium]|nr:ABC-2 family transporter protein [Myxococcaceae bacterium]
MSARSTARAIPTLLKVGFAEAVAYRAEMLVWILATTMPLVMMALWTAVARDAPIGRFGEKEFVGYFLATFIVRQLTGSWAAWQINFEVRQGTLSMRLLRPLNPVVAWAVEHLAYMPLRFAVAIPIAAVMLVGIGGAHLPSSAAMWAVCLLAIVGGWCITFLAGVLIGSLSLFMESSLKLMDVWLAAFFVFSGYLIPIELFPPWLERLTNWLPFRYQIGLGVEILTSRYDLRGALGMLAYQWTYVLVLAVAGHWLWRVGLRRFAAYGG